MCNRVPLSGFSFVKFVFQPLECSQVSLASVESFTSMLVQAQARLILLQKMVTQEFLTTHFTNKLYYLIIDSYKTSHLGGCNGSLEDVASLTRLATQVIQNVKWRVSPLKLPEQFRFHLARVNNQDRTKLSQSIVENVSASLVKSIGMCSSFYVQTLNCISW